MLKAKHAKLAACIAHYAESAEFDTQDSELIVRDYSNPQRRLWLEVRPADMHVGPAYINTSTTYEAGGTLRQDAKRGLLDYMAERTGAERQEDRLIVEDEGVCLDVRVNEPAHIKFGDIEKAQRLLDRWSDYLP